MIKVIRECKICGYKEEYGELSVEQKSILKAAALPCGHMGMGIIEDVLR